MEALYVVDLDGVDVRELDQHSPLLSQKQNQTTKLRTKQS